MKIDLSEIRITKSALTDKIYAGTIAKDNISFEHKVDVTNDFIKAVIEWGAGFKRTITGGGKMYEITVREVKSKK